MIMRVLLTVLCLVFATNASAMDIPDADSAGGQLYASRCSACHTLPHPKRLDWEAWRHMLGVMKMRMDEKGMDIPDDEWRQIAAYVKANAR